MWLLSYVGRWGVGWVCRGCVGVDDALVWMGGVVRDDSGVVVSIRGTGSESS